MVGVSSALRALGRLARIEGFCMPPIGIDELGPDVVFAGHRIVARLGAGGMGVVFKAIDVLLNRTVALKVIAPQWAADPGYRALFLREATSTAELDHPNIIDIYKVDEEAGRLYLTMRYVNGPNLREELSEVGRMSVGRVIPIIRQLAGALDEAHRHDLVHRDVKPHNILLAKQDRGDHVYLTDFGLTKKLDATTLTISRGGVGTPPYWAPEQFRGDRVDARADVYALGIVLYELLTGRQPRLGPNMLPIAGQATGVSKEFDRIIWRAAAYDPGDRYPSPGDLAAAVIAASEGGQAKGRTRRAVAAVAACLSGAVVAVGIAELTGNGDKPTKSGVNQSAHSQSTEAAVTTTTTPSQTTTQDTIDAAAEQRLRAAQALSRRNDGLTKFLQVRVADQNYSVLSNLKCHADGTPPRFAVARVRCQADGNVVTYTQWANLQRKWGFFGPIFNPEWAESRKAPVRFVGTCPIPQKWHRNAFAGFPAASGDLAAQALGGLRLVWSYDRHTVTGEATGRVSTLGKLCAENGTLVG